MVTPDVNKPYSARKLPLAFVLAGGKGSRMHPLTINRAKPAVPFGANYRVIDFALSNIYHSGIRKICILTQYQSESLHRHIRNGWYPRFGIGVNEFITTLPAKQGDTAGWYRGTADSILKNINYIRNERPNIVDILGGDHIYLMDLDKKNTYHQEKDADITISAVPVPLKEAAGNFGVLVVDENMRLIKFEEKPAHPTPMPGNPDYCLASMGNYVFNADVLCAELEEDSAREFTSDHEQISGRPDKYSSHDFGYDILPAAMRKNRRIYVYNFQAEGVPGTTERERGFWRDVGNLDQFYMANMELIERDPVINLYNNQWKILTYTESPQPAKIMSTRDNVGYAMNSLIANGVVVSYAVVENSVVHYGCRINRKSKIKKSILLGRIRIGEKVKIKNAIIDKWVDIPDGTRIGYDRDQDLARGFTVSEGGITVVPRSYSFE